MRKQVIRLASDLGFNVNDKADILPGDLIEMDELFLTNAIVGLKYVSGYKTRRYFKKASTKIISELNKLL
jgi:branched-chain amino acid aminotransferase